MQYTFLGFSTAKIMEFELDMKDMAILRYFVDFRETGKMKAEIVDNKTYYWVKYESIMEEMPFLDLKKKTIMTRMLKLRDLGILTHYTKKNSSGTYSFFGLGQKYFELISDTKTQENNSNNNPKLKEVSSHEGVSFKTDTVSRKNDTRVPQNGHPYPAKMTPNNPSTKDPSTKDYNIKNIKKDSDEIIEYLNAKVGCDYRANTHTTIKLIKARLKEKYTIDDFKVVIDKKSKEWSGTHYEQYLTPNTLFGGKFEQYLKQKVATNQVNSPNKNNEKLRFNNFEARDYDYDALEKKLLGWEE